jgi:hypothetical protein
MTKERADEDLEQPRIGQPLPQADNACIDPEKLISYALDPDSSVGQDKARVFRRALDIERDDWEYLRDCILDQLPDHPVTDVRVPVTERGTHTWEVLVPIQGLGMQSERRLLVITAWKMVNGRPELATIRVAPKNRQLRT